MIQFSVEQYDADIKILRTKEIITNQEQRLFTTWPDRITNQVFHLNRLMIGYYLCTSLAWSRQTFIACSGGLWQRAPSSWLSWRNRLRSAPGMTGSTDMTLAKASRAMGDRTRGAAGILRRKARLSSVYVVTAGRRCPNHHQLAGNKYIWKWKNRIDFILFWIVNDLGKSRPSIQHCHRIDSTKICISCKQIRKEIVPEHFKHQEQINYLSNSQLLC